ncbi:FAD-binding oxidoreductase [Vannielia litorea]|uniref:FAD-binding oxidoreductase n=1 Tax=Vannielia litorea TaxID=1217970 RepID=UPI001BD12F99|nr:FAD-linked oxidase C-terminal domain-containing protein [Vannielia litorea]MBS8228498.1 FAD-binding protein [Vannielia litorea]
MPFQEAQTGLQAVLGDRLSRSKSDLAQHGRSETHFPLTPPEAVAYPETTAEVAGIVKACAEAACPVVGWGAGTSLEGHGLAVQGGLVVDFSRMDRVLEVRAEDMVAVVQPGVTREALNHELRATGLFFPVDPGANATLGGMASTRASGTTAVRYGTMAENVLALEVVLADGSVIRTGSGARKASNGYDLTRLMVGSEGTLGLITELTLKLQGQPEAVAAATCAFPRMGDAVDCVIATIQAGLPMARIEFVDGATVEAVNAYSGAEFPPMPHLLVEFHGSESSVAGDARFFGELVNDMNGQDFSWAERAEDRTALWQMRHHAYWAILASRKSAKAIVTDMCVPISRLAEAVELTAQDIAEAGLEGPILGHVGDGNFHAILLIDKDNPEHWQKAKRIADTMAERALAFGGTITGEHGIGMGKLHLMEAEHGLAWGVMEALKAALDPQGILNPGKMVRARPNGGNSPFPP